MNAEQIYLFDLQGYVVLKGVVPKQLVAEVNEVLDRFEEMDPADYPPPLALALITRITISTSPTFWEQHRLHARLDRTRFSLQRRRQRRPHRSPAGNQKAEDALIRIAATVTSSAMAPSDWQIMTTTPSTTT
jgi:hypothetical protein